MFIPILISLAIIVTTIVMHGFGTGFLLNYLLKNHDLNSDDFTISKSLRILSLTAVFLMILHYFEIALWAAVFLLIPQLDKLSNWEEAIYFSTVTYTTLGYGDITLPPVWRVMSGFEAMNGILMFGWSSAMFYAVVQKIVITIGQRKIIKS